MRIRICTQQRDKGSQEKQQKKHTHTLNNNNNKKKKRKIMKVSSRPHACYTYSHYTKLFAFCLNAFELKASILSLVFLYYG